MEQRLTKASDNSNPNIESLWVTAERQSRGETNGMSQEFSRVCCLLRSTALEIRNSGHQGGNRRRERNLVAFRWTSTWLIQNRAVLVIKFGTPSWELTAFTTSFSAQICIAAHAHSATELQPLDQHESPYQQPTSTLITCWVHSTYYTSLTFASA